MLRFPQFKFSVMFIKIIICLNCFLPDTFLFAQENPKENSLESGAWALQFQITRNFALSRFEGSVISAKRHFSDKKSLRFGLNLNASISDTEQNFTRMVSDTLRETRKNDGENNTQNIELNVQYLFYPSPAKEINLFLGIGPMIGFNRSNSETGLDREPLNPVDSTSKRTSKRWSLGVSANLGVEWFATKSISFLAEYGLSLNYILAKDSSTDRTAGTVTESENKSEIFNLNAASVKFGLSVYF